MMDEGQLAPSPWLSLVACQRAEVEAPLLEPLSEFLVVVVAAAASVVAEVVWVLRAPPMGLPPLPPCDR